MVVPLADSILYIKNRFFCICFLANSNSLKFIWVDLILRERPFNLKEGVLWFFSKKIFWFPMLLKKIFWFWWRKKKSDSEFLSYNLMLNSGKKINILTLCPKKKFMNEKKPIIFPFWKDIRNHEKYHKKIQLTDLIALFHRFLKLLTEYWHAGR